MFDDDPRWGSDPRERDDDARDKDPVDPRDVFVNQLDLPRGHERELVRDRDREYTLRGSESRTLSLAASSASFQRATSRTKTGVPVTLARATFDISVNRDSFAPCRCLVSGG
jgi:hypothetical protein